MSTTLGIFAVILLITLGITYWAARRTTTTSGFYAADTGLTAAQNGLALAGDWASAAAFLGFTGLTALYGMGCNRAVENRCIHEEITMSIRSYVAVALASAICLASPAFAGSHGNWSHKDKGTVIVYGVQVEQKRANERNAHAELIQPNIYRRVDSQTSSSDIAQKIVGPYYCGNDYFGAAEEACGLAPRR